MWHKASDGTYARFITNVTDAETLGSYKVNSYYDYYM